MPLSFAPSGERMTVKQIRGRDDTRRFLESMGFVTGGQVTVVSKIGGNLIVEVKDTRVALSQNMAARIQIEPAI